MTKKIRIFIAIDLPKLVKNELGRLLKTIEKKHWKVGWVESEKLHLTLVFLGEIKSQKLKVPPEGRAGKSKKLKVLEEIVKDVVRDMGPFKISFKGLGVFPSFDWPRVIWLGLKGDLKSLAALQKAIEENLVNQGFSIQKRKFAPHLTLGRIRPVKLRERKEIGRQLAKMRVVDFKSEILVDKVTIFESKLSAKGARYRKLAEIELRN